jgi:hypothetical protein
MRCRNSENTVIPMAAFFQCSNFLVCPPLRQSPCFLGPAYEKAQHQDLRFGLVLLPESFSDRGKSEQ